jgi:hypothetical protein
VTRPARRPGYLPVRVECLIWATGAACIATAAALAAALLPSVEAPRGDGPRTHPQPVRTASTAPAHPSVDKRKFIIEQNVDCWIGQPGATCGTGRTYQ